MDLVLKEDAAVYRMAGSTFIKGIPSGPAKMLAFLERRGELYNREMCTTETGKVTHATASHHVKHLQVHLR